MAVGVTLARIEADVLEIIDRIPPGRVVGHGALGRHLQVDSRHVVHVIASLDDEQRTRRAWWRVVADGGAVGRHAWRDDQMARLRADGVVLSPVGIVQDIEVRRIDDVAVLRRAPRVPFGAPPHGPPVPAGSRARGSKGRPTSTV